MKNQTQSNNQNSKKTKTLRTGRICSIQKNTYMIRFEQEELVGKLKGCFHNERRELPVVGDYVNFEYNTNGDSMIANVCERKSMLKRPDQSGHAMNFVKTMQEQVMVANFDYVFIVASLNDNYNFNRIARYVSITLQGNGIPVVLLSKVDLCKEPEKYIEEIRSLSDKVKVHTFSALHGIGLEPIKEYLTKGTTIAILGSSGVGKSTLVNALAGYDAMKTSGIREEDSKGRHTTTYRQMIFLPNDVILIDTPGMRELGMCDVEEGIQETFDDITELESQCRFGDCRHQSEPGCAIKKAIEEGTLPWKRYALYLSLQKESRFSKRMKAPARF